MGVYKFNDTTSLVYQVDKDFEVSYLIDELNEVQEDWGLDDYKDMNSVDFFDIVVDVMGEFSESILTKTIPEDGILEIPEEDIINQFDKGYKIVYIDFIQKEFEEFDNYEQFKSRFQLYMEEQNQQRKRIRNPKNKQCQQQKDEIIDESSKKSKRQNIIDTINHLLGIEIENYIVKTKIKPRKFIFIDITDLNENIINEIKRIGNQYKLYDVEKNGQNEISLTIK